MRRGEAQSVERVTRSTDLVRDHSGARKYAPYLQICRAAYRNRTDDLRITRRIRAVHGCLDGHTYPARAASCSARVRGSPGPLLANPLAQPIPGRLRLLPILAAPRRVGPAGAARPARARSRQCGAEPHHSPWKESPVSASSHLPSMAAVVSHLVTRPHAPRIVTRPMSA